MQEINAGYSEEGEKEEAREAFRGERLTLHTLPESS